METRGKGFDDTCGAKGLQCGPNRIGRQIKGRQRAVELTFPVVTRRARAGRTEAFVTVGKEGTKRWRRRQIRRLARSHGAIRGTQLIEQHTHGPTVHHDVVGVQREDTWRAGPGPATHSPQRA